MEAACDGLSDPDGLKKPAPGRWSVIDCIEHVCITENLGLKRMHAAGTAPEVEPDAARETAFAASNEGVPVLLAWCDVETGNVDNAAPLLALTPGPSSTGVSTFMPLWFPRVFQLRAALAGKTGKADEAKQNLELFRKLSGG